jgi:hypothetical protein
LIVHRNGMREAAGTFDSALFASTSWNVMPANPGVRTLRTSPARARPASSSPGSAPSSAVIACPSHLTPPFEHAF